MLVPPRLCFIGRIEFERGVAVTVPDMLAGGRITQGELNCLRFVVGLPLSADYICHFFTPRSMYYVVNLVPKAGLEPAHHRWQRILSPPRLPFRHSGKHTRVIVATYENKGGICTAVTLPTSILSLNICCSTVI